MKNINGLFVPEKTVFENLCDRNERNKDVSAIEYFSNNFTYEEFINEIKKYAVSFQKMGIKEGSVVTLCMPGIPEFVISYYALNAIGAVANGVSISFLKNDLKCYTDEKKSTTLVIFDKFYELIKDQIERTQLENIIVTSIDNYMPEDVIFNANKNGNITDIISNIRLPKGKELITISQFIKEGNANIKSFNPARYEESRDTTYLYSSGTTGLPKCIVFRDSAINALVTSHDKIILNEHPGDRSLLIIPPYYATSLVYAINLQLAKGKTLVFQPIYNKYTFGTDLKNLKINHTVAAMSHYSTLVKSNLKYGDLQRLKFPCCGGEAVPYGMAVQINETLRNAGCNSNLIIGGGSSEVGSGIMAAYHIKDTENETGTLFPGVEVKIVDPITRKELPRCTRGEMIVSSPFSMDRYYGNKLATEKYFHQDESGKNWAYPEDIAVENENGSYTILGRKSDSYQKNDKTIYLFDTEEKISTEKEILECEAVALPIANGTKYAQVLHLVINDEYSGCQDEIVRRISNLCPDVDGIKIIESFGTSEITGKRNTKVLLNDRECFYIPNDDSSFKEVNFPENDEPNFKIVGTCKNLAIKALKKKH